MGRGAAGFKRAPKDRLAEGASQAGGWSLKMWARRVIHADVPSILPIETG